MSDFNVQELVIERDDKTIVGRVYVPEDAGDGKRVPMVVCAHDLGQNLQQLDGYARELAKRGYAACCFDFCGDVDSQSRANEGAMTIFTEQQDLENVFDHLFGQPYVDRNNMFLLGAGLGGAVCAPVAARMNGLVKGLILLYPAFGLTGDVNRAWPEGEKVADDATLYGVAVSDEFVEAARVYDPYSLITGFTGPVLIIHGMADEVVASGYSVRAVNMYRNANLELIGEVGHGFDGGAFKYAVKKIVGFIDEEADLPDESGLDGDLNFNAGGMGGMFG